MTGPVESLTMMERFQANYDYLFIELRDPRYVMFDEFAFTKCFDVSDLAVKISLMSY